MKKVITCKVIESQFLTPKQSGSDPKQAMHSKAHGLFYRKNGGYANVYQVNLPGAYTQCDYYA